MKPQPKFCLDCAHCLPGNKLSLPRCALAPMVVDLITGASEHVTCTAARAHRRLCGPSGKNYAPHRLLSVPLSP